MDFWNWQLSDWDFFGRVVNCATVMFATILVAWQQRTVMTGNEQPKPTPNIMEFVNVYESSVYIRATLTDWDKALLRKIIEMDLNFSARGSQEAARELKQKYNRENWNRIRKIIVDMGMGEYISGNGGKSELRVRVSLYDWLGVPRPLRNSASNTRETV